MSGCPQILLPTLWISDETPPKTVVRRAVANSAYKTGNDQPLKRVTHSRASIALTNAFPWP